MCRVEIDLRSRYWAEGRRGGIDGHNREDVLEHRLLDALDPLNSISIRRGPGRRVPKGRPPRMLDEQAVRNHAFSSLVVDCVTAKCRSAGHAVPGAQSPVRTYGNPANKVRIAINLYTDAEGEQERPAGCPAICQLLSAGPDRTQARSG